MKEELDGSGLKPSAEPSALEYLGGLTRKWDRLRRQAVAARKARKNIREIQGPCENLGSYKGPCWTRVPGGTACDSCIAQFPLHNAYHAAVRKAAAALTALRREIRRIETARPSATNGSGPK